MSYLVGLQKKLLGLYAFKFHVFKPCSYVFKPYTFKPHVFKPCFHIFKPYFFKLYFIGSLHFFDSDLILPDPCLRNIYLNTSIMRCVLKQISLRIYKANVRGMRLRLQKL